jgi:hypothetical protein
MVIRNRDALWLNQQYRDWKGIKQQYVTTIDNDEEDKPFLDISNGVPNDEDTGRELETKVNRI